MVSNKRWLVVLLAGGVLIMLAAAVTIYALRGSKYLASSQTPIISSTATPPAQAVAYERLRAAVQGPIELSLEGDFPRGVIGRVEAEGNGPVEIAQSYLSDYQDFYLQDDPNLDLHLLRSSPDQAVFYQTYLGVRVYGGEITVLTDEEAVLGTVGSLLSAGSELEVAPGLTPERALQVATDQLGLETYQIMGRPRLVVFDPAIAGLEGGEPALAWQINLQGATTVQAIVDADTGDLLHSYVLLEDHQDPYHLDVYMLPGVLIKDYGCNLFEPGFHLADESGIFDPANAPGDASTARNSAAAVWNYFHDAHGFHSYDDDGEPLWVYVQSPTERGAIFWPCGLFEFGTGNAVLDVFAHEFTHGVVDHFSDLAYYGQSGALNESVADVMAAMVDGNWTIGESAGIGTIRDLSNPNAFNDPDHMAEFQIIIDCADPADPFDNDNGCVHSNSGIPNYVAYLLAKGGVHPDSQVVVQALGSDSTGWLYLNAIAKGLGSSAQFIDARNMTVLYALSAYGLEGACKVRNAWFAVGIGNPDFDCDGQPESPADSDGDLVPDALDNCVSVFNPVQLDSDDDGFGDLCDLPDLDQDDDGMPDAYETKLADPYALCPTPGVWCNTADYDGDGIANEDDNCRFVANQDQADVDNDGEGDACDPDSDGDGISDNDDNCINTANPEQANADGDLAGDECDPNPTCDDVYAWSAGSTIYVGPDPVQVPPEPISDPFACPDLVLVDGIEWPDDPPEINPDGQRHPIEVIRGEEPVTVIPLPVCLPEGALQSPSQIRQLVQLESQADGLTAWIVDDLGESVARDRDQGSAAQLPFPPRGGDGYYLMVGQAGAAEGDSVEFELMVRCADREPAERIPPPAIGEDLDRQDQGGTASPTATRETSTPAPTATPRVTDAPEPTATETPRTTPTPAPTDTPRVEPTSTPRRGLPSSTPTPGGRG